MNLDLFTQKIESYFTPNQTILLAFSGGLDSCVLFHLLVVSKINFSVAHCNFQLRGEEADGDELFVKNICEKHQIPFFVTHFETKKIAEREKQSIQVTARKLRYEWFDALCEKYAFDLLATAHHLDDSLETFLINLSRGTGLSGLTGIPQKNKKTIRPLSNFSREEIANYAKINKLNWREDSSNQEEKYVRNKIRHQITPKLKELNPTFLANFAQTILILEENNQILQTHFQAIFASVLLPETNLEEEIYYLDCEKIKELKPQNTYLYSIFERFGFQSVEEIRKILFAGSGKEMSNENYRIIKNRNELIVTKKQIKTLDFFLIDSLTKDLKIPIHLQFLLSETKDGNATESINFDKIKMPLHLRKWQNGDVFYPLGLNGAKKVSKYFKDEKFSTLDKENTWLLCNADEQIIWVVNHRLDNRFKITSETKSFLNITVC